MTLLPPADLLERIAGVEEGLRGNKKLGRAGTIGVVVSVSQLVLDQWLHITDTSAGRWWQTVAVALLVASFALFVRSRVWLRESSRPFRYTCSLDEFVALGQLTQGLFPELAGWMKFDLAKLLNDRLGRLSFLDAPVTTADGSTEHIHISGEFVARARRDGRWDFEVAPRVRVGSDDRPATLAHSVPYVLPSTGSGKEDLLTSGEKSGPKLERDDYETILERTYYSLASEIYRQIRSDVQAKIDLLPTKYLRATGYLYEGEDYTRSNTLYGLDSAISLYHLAIELFDPRWRDRPLGRGRVAFHGLARWGREKAKWARVRLARVWPAMAKVEIKTARAEVGYANALLYRRTLAGMAGRRKNPIYEARTVAAWAANRLERLPGDDPTVMQARFEAYVCLALAWHHLDCPELAQGSLDKAHGVFPAAYEEDPRYLYVQGLIEDQPSSALRFLRLAVEREPRFEVAQFELAYTAEMLWRTRDVLESSVASLILADYDEILKLNPANVAAWAHAAYIHWLCGSRDEARGYYERGRAFRERQRERAVAQLDYGLARIAAEEGDYQAAYRHYVNASSGQLLEGVSGWKSTSAQFYFFESISAAMLARYEAYADKAIRVLTESPGPPSEKRVSEIVQSFVRNDYGEACYSYYLRTFDSKRLREAEDAYGEAKRLNREATLPYYNLYLLRLFGIRDDAQYEQNFKAAIEELDQLLSYEPRWADAMLARLAAPAEAASKEWSRSECHRCARAEAARMADDDVALGYLRKLLPQRWLWKDGRGDAGPSRHPEFDWERVRRAQQDEPMHWESQFDDLQVEALLEWALIQIAADGNRSDGDRSDGHRGLAVARPLLDCIRDHFWPGDFRVLFACYQLDREDTRARDGICRLMRRWLSSNPRAYWALELATTDFFDLEGRRLDLFDAETRRRFVDEAIESVRGSPKHTEFLEWAQQERQRLVAAAMPPSPEAPGT